MNITLDTELEAEEPEPDRRPFCRYCGMRFGLAAEKAEHERCHTEFDPAKPAAQKSIP